MKPAGVTDEQRARTQRQFEKTDVMDPELLAAITSIQNDPKLKMVNNGQLVGQMIKQVTDNWNKSRAAVAPADAAAKAAAARAKYADMVAKGGYTTAELDAARNEMSELAGTAGGLSMTTMISEDTPTAVAAAMTKISDARLAFERDPTPENQRLLNDAIGAAGSTLNPDGGGITIESIMSHMETPDAALGEVLVNGLQNHIAVNGTLLSAMGYSDVKDQNGVSEQDSILKMLFSFGFAFVLYQKSNH
jgi:hypothetical protein